MTTTIYDVLDLVRKTSTTNPEHGIQFERLMVQYLPFDPFYAEQFGDVWMGSEGLVLPRTILNLQHSVHKVWPVVASRS